MSEKGREAGLTLFTDKKICLKESEVWQKVISSKIIVGALVTQGLPSSFLSRRVA